MNDTKHLYFYANPDGRCYCSNQAPNRYGHKKVKNHHIFIEGRRRIHAYIENPDICKVEYTEVSGYEGPIELWDYKSHYFIGMDSIKFEDCNTWMNSQQMEVGPVICLKIIGYVPTWEDEPIKIEIESNN